MQKTTPSGSTFTLRADAEFGTLVIADHPDAPTNMRKTEIGRIIDGGFQPAPFSMATLAPASLRAIAELIEELAEGEDG